MRISKINARLPASVRALPATHPSPFLLLRILALVGTYVIFERAVSRFSRLAVDAYFESSIVVELLRAFSPYLLICIVLGVFL
ncbi:MAG: hypothetical protein ACI915_000469 [Gammaproteobacteria bacterium]|jgi:hypothetical protein